MSPEQNFDDLRRLLALKRQEQPPPGYFHRFSGEVIARIRAGEQAPDRSIGRFDLPWLRKFWAALETKPALAGAVGASICAMMLWAVVSTENLGGTSAVIPGGPFTDAFESPSAAAPAPALTGMTVSFSSTNGVSSQGHLSILGGGWPKASFARFPMTEN